MGSAMPEPSASKPKPSTTAVLHYAEIGLKGGYRPFFEKKLVENLRAACTLHGVDLEEVRREHGRIVCTFGEQDPEKIEATLQHVFGLQHFAFVDERESTVEAILHYATEFLEHAKAEGKSNVGLVTRRADKRFPLSSLELNKRIGAEAQRLGLRINFKNPDETLYTEIATTRTYLHSRKVRGPGGLPVGASGKVLCLLSGGIDSAVAAWLAMKRGCRVDFLHFHSFRENQEALESKLGGIVEALNRYQFFCRLFLVPYHSYQIWAAGRVPEALDLVAFKNFTFRFAQVVARRKHCRALLSGDSLGQVASQTLPNLAATDEGLTMPVLRPLVSFDKTEIIALARRIGTYEESIKPYKDCCSIIARKPATAVKRSQLRQVFPAEELKPLVAKCLGEMGMFKFGQPAHEEDTAEKPLPTGDLSAT